MRHRACHVAGAYTIRSTDPPVDSSSGCRDRCTPPTPRRPRLEQQVRTHVSDAREDHSDHRGRRTCLPDDTHTPRELRLWHALSLCASPRLHVIRVSRTPRAFVLEQVVVSRTVVPPFYSRIALLAGRARRSALQSLIRSPVTRSYLGVPRTRSPMSNCDALWLVWEEPGPGR